jgi:hypothetical protein
LDFEVFLDRRRAERYVAACQALDSRLRDRLVLVLTGMPKGFPKSRVLECVMRLRPFCHGVGFQSDSMDAPAVELLLLGTSIVVLQDPGGLPHAAREIRPPARLSVARPGSPSGVVGRHAAPGRAGCRSHRHGGG